MKNKNGRKRCIIIGVLIILIILFGIIVYLNYKKNNDYAENAQALVENIVNEENEKIENVIQEEVLPEKEINIFKGDDRPIAVMIDNNINAQPQSALNRAYLVYEIIVEGGETRLMALFKNVDLTQNDVVVGPIRSARHYFIDYALENDAIYAHLGQSPEATNYMTNFNIADINGQIYDTGKSRTESSLYWRSKEKKSPHNAYTSLSSLLTICEKKNYETKSSKKSVLNYVSEDVNLEGEDVVIANSVTIPYTSKHSVKYIYDAQTQKYIRYSKGKKQVDEETGEDVVTKNLIIEFIKNTTLNDGENKDRQELDNFVTAKGYYITNGKAIEIECKKECVGGQTKYVDMQGNEICINDGNTWINICPIDANVVIE